MDEAVEKYKVIGGEEVTPIIVLTSNLKEFEEFCALTGRDSKSAIAVKQAHQLSFYHDLRIAHYGDYWLNAAYATPEYKDRINKQLLEDWEKNNG